jgi:DNA-binding CsgD family transcriptional regulator
MAASGTLHERDLRVLTAVVEDGLRDDPGPAMPWAVLETLLQLVPCEEMDFTLHFTPDAVREHSLVIMQGIGDGERVTRSAGSWSPPYPKFWAHRAQFLPSTYPARTGDTVSVLRWSDFYTAYELNNVPYYAEYLRPIGDKYVVNVNLPTALGGTLTLYRKSGPDFTERDRLVLQLLRPHLHEVYLDAERRRHGIPHVSRREREVLQLVAQGYSNADIARILFISVATVAKHMEHIFDRTGVRTRGAAAALALPPVSPFTGPPPKAGH